MGQLPPTVAAGGGVVCSAKLIPVPRQASVVPMRARKTVKITTDKSEKVEASAQPTPEVQK